jgi:hypothetical protein
MDLSPPTPRNELADRFAGSNNTQGHYYFYPEETRRIKYLAGCRIEVML